jgi:3',5'-cyclic AMP phosphodiesterase CpdA
METSGHGVGTPLRLVQLADTHLSRWEGPLRRNFRTLAAFVNTVLRPDLIIHAGDAILSNPDAEEDYLAAKEIFELIDAPIRFIPGNHDIGEPYERTWWTTTAERLARFRRHFGETPWLEWFGDVALLGLNSQVFGTGLPEEESQWQWLECVARTVEGRPVLLFQHKSFWTSYRGSDGRHGGIHRADRERILEILRPTRFLGVSNGDVHRYRKVWHGDHLELWGPSTAFLVHREETEKLPAGLEQLGVALFEFAGERVTVTFQTTPGLEEVEVGGFEESRLIRTEIATAINGFQAPTGPSST